MANAVQHYTAYKPRPFTREERDQVTILYGGLTWKHEKLIQGALHNMGYKAEPLPNIDRNDLDAGKELIDTGACCPTIFTTGNLVSLLKNKLKTEKREDVVNNYVFLTAGSCGPCRFGQYHESYTMALDGLGLRDFRLFLLAQDELDQGAQGGGGVDINLPLSLGLFWSIFAGDMLTDLEYLTRPYEKTPGQTDKVLAECADYLYEAFRNRPQASPSKWGMLAWHLLTPYFSKALQEVKRRFDQIELDRLQVKPRVKITGEFWLQTHEGEGNYNIKRWLEQEGSEVTPPPVAVWIQYLMHIPIWDLAKKAETDGKVRRKVKMLKFAEHMFLRIYNGMRKSLNNLPQELPDQEELKELSAPYYHHGLRGGEGHMLVGKALYAYHHKKANMICELSPYSCMPNTMSIGAMANVLGKYPDLLYAPIEIKGDAEVHALSRCQMILTEAKKRAQSEFAEALAKSGLTLEALRRIEERFPEVRRAGYRVPNMGYSCTAANYALHLAGK